MAKNKEEIIDLEGEEWRDIHVIKGVNFFGYYQISNLDGNFIREWESTTEAKREKFQHSDIRSCVCKRQKTAGGFKWMYLSEYEELNK